MILNVKETDVRHMFLYRRKFLNDKSVTSVFTIVQYLKRSLKINDISLADMITNNILLRK